RLLLSQIPHHTETLPAPPLLRPLGHVSRRPFLAQPPASLRATHARHRVAVRRFFFFQAEDGIRDGHVTGVQTCALPISPSRRRSAWSVFSTCSLLSSKEACTCSRRIHVRRVRFPSPRRRRA